MKLECDMCEGTGEMVPERDGAEFKKTGKFLPATDENLKDHCRGGGDLGECGCCEGRGYIVTQTEASRYLMRQVKQGMGIVKELSTLCPPELNQQIPDLRIRAIHVMEQLSAVTRIVRKEIDDYT